MCSSTRSEWTLRGFFPALTALALIAGAWTPAGAIFGKIGTEFQVNTYTTSRQAYPDVAFDAAGGFLVVWADAASNDIHGQRYASTGAVVGTEFRVNAETTGSQFWPVIGFTPTGGGAFVAIWSDDRDSPTTYDVYGNVVVGTAPLFPSDTLMNTYTTGDQTLSSVAILPDGGAAIVWQSDGQDGDNFGIFGQRRSSVGAALGTEFQINSYSTNRQDSAAVAALPDGGFIVTWGGYGPTSTTDDILARRYDSLGGPVGTEFRVNSATPAGIQAYPAVASEPAGGFVVVWSSFDASYSLRAQRYDSAGTPSGTEIVVSSDTVGSSVVAADSSGNFMVVWDDYDALGLAGRRFNSGGVPISGEFSVVSGGYKASIDADASGGFLVAWHNYDGDDDGIFAQRFGDIADLCPTSPTSGCRTAQKSVLLIKDNADNTKDKLIWKWIRGASTTEAEFGDPTTTRNYALCVYDGGGRLISADVAADATKWQALKYKDSSGGADGIQKIILKPSATSNSKVLVKGKGTNLPDTTLGSLTLPITAQLINDETSVCFQGVYAAPQIIKNDTTQFKAKAGS